MSANKNAIAIETMKRAALTLAAAALLATPAPALADRLIDDVKGVTWTKTGEIKRFTGLLLTDTGMVKAYLGEKDKRPKKVTFYYDANGAVLMPGFTDAAIDMRAFTIASLGLDLHDAAGPSGVLSALGKFAADNPDRRWLFGYGLFGPWDQMPLTATDLDLVEPDRPVVLFSADGGLAIANGRALTLMGQSGDGRLTGAALAEAKRQLPVPSGAERDLAFITAQDRLLAAGVTALSDIGSDITLWQSYRRAGDEERLHLRISSYADGTAQIVAIAGPRPTPWLYQERLRLTGMAVRLDGALAGQQSWLNFPYSNGMNKGAPLLGDAELRNTLVRAAMDNFAIVVEAHGDAAVAEALFAFDDIGGNFPKQADWRVIGMDVVDEAAMAKVGGRYLTLRSGFLGESFGAARQIVGADNARKLWPMGALNRNGAKLSLGSFAPDGHPNGVLNFSYALDQSNGAGVAEYPSRMQVLHAMTHGAAEAGGLDGFTGALEIGKWGDFILLDVDPTTATMLDVRQAKVNETWIGGVRVWQRDGGAAIVPLNPGR
jgi:predicted amidohydrolase YtcJ